jgi:hypothetical protein
MSDPARRSRPGPGRSQGQVKVTHRRRSQDRLRVRHVQTARPVQLRLSLCRASARLVPGSGPEAPVMAQRPRRSVPAGVAQAGLHRWRRQLQRRPAGRHQESGLGFQLLTRTLVAAGVQSRLGRWPRRRQAWSLSAASRGWFRACHGGVQPLRGTC